ncbi:hypothetical protein LTS18_007098, partial [Coniosporium uncinatum]
GKPTSTRHKIRLLSLDRIPKITLRALSASPVTANMLTGPPPSASNPNTNPTGFDYAALKPGKPTLFLLTLTNPLEESVSVTLATEGMTQGMIKSKITILCPQFEIGANTDVWDEALNPVRDKRRSNMLALGSASASTAGLAAGAGGAGDAAEPKQAEAGKIWDKGRNWTSVIVEVVPGATLTAGREVDEQMRREETEGEDVLEIPVFVRMGYEVEVQGDSGVGEREEGRKRGEKERREEAFWCVLGVGRVGRV